MKRYFAAAMIAVMIGMAACGQKAPEKAPAAESEAVSETAAETPAETEAQTAAVPEAEASAAEAPDTEMPEEEDAETAAQTATAQETEAPAETAPETREAGPEGYTNAQIRESQNDMCAAIDEAKAAFGILVIDPKFDGSWTDVQPAIEKNGYAQQYPYLTSLGIESYIETEGKGLICIIPRDMKTSLAVNLVDEDLEVKKVLFRHELAYPLIIRADIDPKEPELMVNAVSGDYQATFYLMSEKGKLIMPNGGGVYDFTR